MTISSLASLERIAALKPGEAMDAMLRALRRLASGTSLVELAKPEPAQDSQVLATRVASVIARTITDPAARLDRDAALRLAASGPFAQRLFAVSGFGSADHVLRILGASDTEGLRRLAQVDREAFAKAWLLLSMDTALPIDMAEILRAPPVLGLLAAASLISQLPIATEAGHQRREQLLGLAAMLKPARLHLNQDLLILLTSAWMLCSYAAARDKHEVKRVLNQVLRDWGTGQGLRDTPPLASRALPSKPTLLVAAEVMHSNHVQYRYFGQYLRQLRTRFRLVLVTEESQVDDHVRMLFDEVRPFQRGRGTEYLSTVMSDIEALGPDIIFWPSVGMRHWGPVLANFRLAPIQLAGLGHSASTFCDAIDYYLTEEGYVGDAALLSEQLVLLPDDSLLFESSPHYRPIAPSIRSVADPLRVALPSNLLKLNPRFLAVLQRIRKGSGRTIQFQVFPNVTGLELIATRRVFARHFPGSIVHPTMAYGDYLAKLNECDVNLSPFPFGGLHSVVDSLRQGIPVVAQEGMDLHSRTDSMLLRRLGMPEWLIAKDEETYIAAALRVIDNDAERLALSRQALALDIDRLLFGDATTPQRHEVVDAVWWMFLQHEAIKASGRKVFREVDRRWFPAVDPSMEA